MRADTLYFHADVYSPFGGGLYAFAPPPPLYGCAEELFAIVKVDVAGL